MYKIAYLIPYFGKLPKGFDTWLLSCRLNETIDWIILTDDKSVYDYPSNVKVHYCSFEQIKNRIQSHFDFKVNINRPWRLCDFRPAYGEIFKKELEDYDFWGHCDLDLIWGDIRKFISDDILSTYDKIGFQGHSTLYRNNENNNSLYKTIVPNHETYIDVFSGEEGKCFDETGISAIYEYLGIPYYKKTNFAHLDMFTTSFFLGHLPIEEDYKNKHQIFIWKDGKLFREYLYQNKVYKEEYMYLHFFCRPITYKVTNFDNRTKIVIYPDVVKNFDFEIDNKFIRKHGSCTALHFYSKVFYERRKKLTPKKIMKAIKTKIIRSIKRSNSKKASRSQKTK